MTREPLALYIFRLVLALSLFALMFMLYWSSVLLEEDTKALQSTVLQLHTELLGFRKEVSETLRNQPFVQIAQTPQQNIEKRPFIDPALPNILQEDKFYSETLPKMLGKDFRPYGTFKNATVGRPDNLNPFSGWGNVAQFIALCSVSVAKLQFGQYETFSPNMAIKMEERINPNSGVPEYWVHLRDNVYWQPLQQEFFPGDVKLAPFFLEKHKVTAYDFKFYVDALKNTYNQQLGASSARTLWGDIEEIQVLDDLTFVVRWKYKEVMENGKKVKKIRYIAKQLTGGLKPLASFVYKYFPDGKKIIEDDSAPDTYQMSSLWAQNLAQHWAKNIIPSCGPWTFDGMTEREIKFRRNSNYYNPYEVLAEGNVYEFKDSVEAEWQDFKANKIDIYTLQPDQQLELDHFMNSTMYKQQVSKGESIKSLVYLSRSYTYVGWNEANPLFKSKKVRQALTMAIDRRRIIREYRNGMAEEITGTFFYNSPSYDHSIQPLPFDLQKARILLQEEGWFDSNGDGIIDKEINGKRVPFKFNLIYYVKNTAGKGICEYIATALKEVGIVCNLDGRDVADLTSVYDDKSFDAIFLGWSLGTPPEEPRQLWSSQGAKEKGSSNAIGFANKEIDEIIDQIEYEYDPKKRQDLYFHFDRILYDEQPYTFLFSPKTTLVYREYLQNVLIPAERQDLVPGANISEPDFSIFMLQRK